MEEFSDREMQIAAYESHINEMEAMLDIYQEMYRRYAPTIGMEHKVAEIQRLSLNTEVQIEAFKCRIVTLQQEDA